MTKFSGKKQSEKRQQWRRTHAQQYNKSLKKTPSKKKKKRRTTLGLPSTPTPQVIIVNPEDAGEILKTVIKKGGKKTRKNKRKRRRKTRKNKRKTRRNKRKRRKKTKRKKRRQRGGKLDLSFEEPDTMYQDSQAAMKGAIYKAEVNKAQLSKLQKGGRQTAVPQFQGAGKANDNIAKTLKTLLNVRIDAQGDRFAGSPSDL